MYRVGGKKVRETIGTLATIPNVAHARERARESMRQAEAGIHPVIARKQKLPMSPEGPLFAAVAERYLVEYVERNTRPATSRETRRLLERDVFPRWGARPIREITKADVNDLLDIKAAVRDRPRKGRNAGAGIQANRTLTRLRTFFRWAKDMDLIDADPAEGVRRRVKETARDRALSDDEIRLFWISCDRLGWPFGPLFKLLLLTGQRLGEVAGMDWGEIELEKRQWTIPRHRAKNDRTHVVHLSNQALAIIESLPQIEVPQDAGGKPLIAARFLFTTTGLKPVSGFSHAKAAVDRYMLVLLGKELAGQGREAAEASIDDWILHDLRRSAATGMAGMNIPPHVVDKILNHVSGTIRGVAAVYNRHAYLEERKAALEAWGRYVEDLVRPVGGNVVELATALTT